jgi:hypothetical protein
MAVTVSGSEPELQPEQRAEESGIDLEGRKIEKLVDLST